MSFSHFNFQNSDPVGKMKLVEAKFTLKSGLVDEKRKAFGEIHNKRDVTTTTDASKNG
jgi:hypothetical protein